MAKQKQHKYPPRITIELDSAEFREQAQRAVRKMGYLTLSEFIREKLADVVNAQNKPIRTTPQ